MLRRIRLFNYGPLSNSLELGPDDTLSIDGYTGEVFLGAVEIIEPEQPLASSDKESPNFKQYLNTYAEWKREFSRSAIKNQEGLEGWR